MRMPDKRKPGVALRAVSYNIHSCVGRDNRKAPERIVEVLKSTGGTIIGLQEVDSRIGGRSNLDQFRFLAEHSGMTSIAGPNVVEHRGEYGNILLTSWPVVESRLLRLHVGRYEPRGAIIATLLCEGIRIQVVNTHLGLRLSERRKQVASLLEASSEFAGPTLFLGDFNVWMRRSMLLSRLGAPLAAVFNPSTFPAGRPLIALDRIWTRPPDAMRSVHVPRTALTSIASDHLPVIADIELS